MNRISLTFNMAALVVLGTLVFSMPTYGAKRWTPTKLGKGSNIDVGFHGFTVNSIDVTPGGKIDLDGCASDVDYWTDGGKSGTAEDSFEDVPPNRYGWTWSCTGGKLSAIHSSYVDWTAPLAIGTYKVTLTVKDRPTPLGKGQTGSRRDGSGSATLTVRVCKPVHEVKILAPKGAVRGTVKIRLEIRARLANCPSLDVSWLEDTTNRTGEWVQADPPECVSTSTDDDGITTELYEIDWDTTCLNNGQHTLRCEAHFTVNGSKVPVKEIAQSTVSVGNPGVDTPVR